ncbi:outer membrane lipid asymmetry maintenance protein MlaD [Pseudoroseomonas globiformis]|uniref:Outer membrane lipid asymmetry maintenance protein MlaD n=1 Tax=Teichococcus globiformis TaxID=2307229 RepID=A0ABV7G6B5_9PROT
MAGATQGRNWAEILTGAVIIAVAAGFLFFAIGQSGRNFTSGSGTSLTARFDNIDGISPGADVRIGGVRVGSVVEQHIDPRTYLAVLTLNVQPGIEVPEDSSAEITSEGLLGGKYIALVPGGSERMLPSGGTITITQSSVSLEALLGRFIFSVTQLNAGTGEQGGNQEGGTGEGARQGGSATPAPAPTRP